MLAVSGFEISDPAVGPDRHVRRIRLARIGREHGADVSRPSGVRAPAPLPDSWPRCGARCGVSRRTAATSKPLVRSAPAAAGCRLRVDASETPAASSRTCAPARSLHKTRWSGPVRIGDRLAQARTALGCGGPQPHRPSSSSTRVSRWSADGCIQRARRASRMPGLNFGAGRGRGPCTVPRPGVSPASGPTTVASPAPYRRVRRDLSPLDAGV